MAEDFQSLTQSLHQLGHFSPQQISEITGKIQSVRVSKKQTYLKAGQTCRSFAFLQQGSLLHYEDSLADDRIIDLLLPGDWVLDHRSFTLQQPSQNTIEAYEESIIYYLSIDDLHTLIAQSPIYFQLGRLLENDQRSTGASPEQRYRQLLDQRPQVLQKFPLKYVASYLDMVPETLSRVRRKIKE